MVMQSELNGVMRVVMEPLLGDMPLIGALSVFFLKKPSEPSSSSSSSSSSSEQHGAGTNHVHESRRIAGGRKKKGTKVRSGVMIDGFTSQL
ncbi:hypothetical protein F2P81_018189 [Scophthalmus maximus]|uniref:Synaptotagmin SMP domain-containing protein n=1 Tax=Scophthalmus maximus TaxID=52904 RepID=A0A6A4SDV2_SCOMX|nr:hypothetical protein F2P81_018189 [Scophthalmus maximus]